MISKEEVEHIAKLARLQLSEAETQKMQKDLSGILDYFDVLKKAPKPSGSIKKEALKTQLRQDQALPKPASYANNLVANAPDNKDGYIKVKSIL